MSTEITRLPVSDVDLSSISVSSGSAYAAVDDVIGSPDDDSSFIYATLPGSNGYSYGLAGFAFNALGIPAGATINSVQVTARHRITQTGYSMGGQLVLKVGGTYYYSGTWNGEGTTTYNNYSYTWTTNPMGGVAWTADDLNGTGSNVLSAFGFYLRTYKYNYGYYYTYCTQVYLTISYEEPTVYAYALSGNGLWLPSAHFGTG